MDQKTSILVNRQVPEYVREEYPLFISFLEAYYEFLENKQGTKNNDLLNQSKKLKTITDVDISLDDFEEYFLNTFASFVPVNSTVNKAFLLKNILPLYQSKGSEKSFKLLFRFLFDQEIDVFYPGNRILRASDGKWKVPQSLKISSDISSLYTGNGTNKTFKIIQNVDASKISVFVNNVLQTSGYTVFKEYKTIEFSSAPTSNSNIEIFYNTSLDKSITLNRQVVGSISGASAIVESVFPQILSNSTIFELYLDKKSVTGVFEQGEELTSSVWVDDTLVSLRLRTISEIQKIDVANTGANYNIGDPVLVLAPGSAKTPTAIVTKVFKGNIDNINILESGAGFKVGGQILADGYGPPFVDIEIVSIDTNSSNTVNTFSVFKDVILDIDPANTAINAVSYGLSAISGNQNTVIQQAFSNVAFVNIGELIGIQINSSEVEFNTSPILDVESASLVIPPVGYSSSNTTIYIKSFGSLGKTAIHHGGSGYQVRDILQFTNQPGQFGLGAAAEVTGVSANGGITEVTFVPYAISGKANVFSSNVTVIGTNTYFQQEVYVGSKLRINGEDKVVVSIASNTSMNVNSAFANNASNVYVRLYEKYLIGGQNYSQDQLPTVNVISSTGSNANVSVVAVFGDGEILQPLLGNNKPGGIQEITVIDPGKSLLSVPLIDLTTRGDGTALATTNLVSSFETSSGRWTNSDGMLSSEDVKIQGLNYYIDQSYVIQSSIELSKYKQILKNLLHPAGSIAYAEVLRQDNVVLPAANVVTEVSIGTP